ncbi:MAG: ferrous iron transport protein B [Promethearchaeota archaeon]
MHQHSGHLQRELEKDTSKKNIILVGNPNVGKSVVFGRLTGHYAEVSNYPGTTVEVSIGSLRMGTQHYRVIDSPGIGSLLPLSEDEAITRRILNSSNIHAVIQVADSKNLRRSLHLTLQLIQMGFPIILLLNMADEAHSRGIKIDTKKLQNKLGIPVISAIATVNKGISELRYQIGRGEVRSGAIRITYPDEIETALIRIEKMIDSIVPFSSRASALFLLRGDREIYQWIKQNTNPQTVEKIDEIKRSIQQSTGQSIDQIITQRNNILIRGLIKECSSQKPVKEHRLSETISEATMKPLTGVFIFLGTLILMFLFVGIFGAIFLVELLETYLFGEIIVPWLTDVIESLIPNSIIQELLVGEYGMLSVGLPYAIAIVLPIITTFFLLFAILEDSGYLPRLAMMADRLFKHIGLNGKAVLPIILGTGCDTMATITTRVLETKRDRTIVTFILALGIPCSAQLGVILGILTSISPLGLFIFLATVTSQVLLVAWMASKLLPGEKTPFILEIPPMRIPKFENVVFKTISRVEWFLKEAIPLFMIGTLMISLASLVQINPEIAIQPSTGSNEGTNILELLGNLMEVIVVHGLGLPKEASISFLLGFLRRDYGVVFLRDQAVTAQQMVIGTVVLTLFVPCIANFLVIIKERGMKTAMAIIGFIIPFAFLVGTVLNHLLNLIMPILSQWGLHL